MEILFLLWLVINVTGLSFMIVDKQLAIHHKKRISEKTLILIACFGGALLMWIGMYLIHHKTKHLQFTAGLPLITAVHFILIYLLLK